MTNWLRPSDEVALFILDDSGIFVSEARDHVELFNTAATFVWCCLEDGMAPADIVEAYATTFAMARDRAQETVHDLLHRWHGLGYLLGAPPEPAPEIDFTTALGRLLVNPALRTAFADQPAEAVRRMGVRAADHAPLAALSPVEIEQQAHALRQKAASISHHAGLAANRATGSFLRRTLSPQTPRTDQSRRYQVVGTTLQIRYANAGVADLVHPVLANLTIANDGPADMILDVLEAGGGYFLLEDGEPLYRCGQTTEIAPMVIFAIKAIAMNRTKSLMLIHAGAVLQNERCLLLPGPSGGGKTTLTGALIQSGFGYGAEDAVMLNPSTQSVLPLPLSLAVKYDAAEPLAAYYPALESLPVHVRQDGRRLRYLCPPSSVLPNDPAQTYPVDWIIFPTRVPGAAPAVQALGKAEALQQLLTHCMSAADSLDIAGVRQLVQWMRTVACYELHYSALPDAISEIGRLTGFSPTTSLKCADKV